MDKKIVEIAERIEEEIKRLAELTGATHIDAVFIDGSFMLDDYTDLKNRKFSIFKDGGKNE